MAITIKVVPSALRSAANRQRSTTARIQEAVDETQAILNQLRNVWHGNSGDDAAESLQELLNAGKDAAEGGTASAEKLDVVASAFEEADGGNSWVAPLIFTRVQNLLACAIPRFLIRISTYLFIDTEEVRQLAARCTQLSSVYTECAENVNEMLTSLQGDWEGRSYNKYISEVSELVTGLSGMSERMTEMANRLNLAADRYEDLDNSL